MCGIAGIVGEVDKTLLKKMTDVLQHRGPDDSGIFLDDGIGLGNRRLSIIDIKSGHQPVHNENETMWLVFNGEIYNYLDLKRNLESKGHKFYTNSDTETILHSYEEYGNEFPKKLRGMFAIAIWDSIKKKLILVRDRLGIKPLYYTLNNNNFLFASEIKSILQYKNIKRKVDLEALQNFLTFGYVPSPRTMFDQIKKLQAGRLLTYQKNKIKISKFWDLEYKNLIFNENYCIKKLQKLLKESIKIRLMSEVPLGVFLSGGLDSSSIVALMSSFGKVKTISAGFEEGGYYDELKYAKLVADFFNTDHHEITLKSKDIKILPKIVWHFDEPVADSSSIPEFLISEKSKKYVTVVLVGEGGDELFAGYRQYKIISSINKFKFFSTFKKSFSIASHMAKIIPKRKPRRYLEFISTFGQNLDNPKENFKSLIQVFDYKEKNEILKKCEKEDILDYYFKDSNYLKNMFIFGLKVPLPDMLLMNVDKMTMAHSVEARVPFLDHKLVEFCSIIPFDMKLKGFNEKYILKKTMHNILPKEILKRKKHPFTVPIISWFENGLMETSNQFLSKVIIKKQGYFKYNYIEKIFRKKNYNQLWLLLLFQIWHNIFIDEVNLKELKSDLSL